MYLRLQNAISMIWCRRLWWWYWWPRWHWYLLFLILLLLAVVVVADAAFEYIATDFLFNCNDLLLAPMLQILHTDFEYIATALLLDCNDLNCYSASFKCFTTTASTLLSDVSLLSCFQIHCNWFFYSIAMISTSLLFTLFTFRRYFASRLQLMLSFSSYKLFF